jgi:hypothetical protein
MKYVMLICDDPTIWANLDPERLKAEYDKIFEWIGKWEQRGRIVAGGAELQPPTSARTVRQGPDGGTVVTDGPYLEIKEVVGGFMMLEADSIDEAIEVAREWPGIAYGAAVEVRPVVVH